jgi:hypothetical protein
VLLARAGRLTARLIGLTETSTESCLEQTSLFAMMVKESLAILFYQEDATTAGS